MDGFFRENEILHYFINNKYERIIFIRNGIADCRTIDIYSSETKPEVRFTDELYKEFEDGNLEILIDDPIAKVYEEDELSECSKLKRDTAFEIAEFIAGKEHEPDVFDENYRRQRILEAIERFHKTEPTIYKYLRIYWQGGKVREAFTPNLYRCGGRGVEKNLTKDKKFGRPCGQPKHRTDIKYNFLGDVKIDKKKNGINITEDIKDKIRMIIKKFRKSNIPIKHIWEKFIKEYYPEKDEDEIPKYGQFVYWTRRLKNDKGRPIIEATGRKKNRNYKVSKTNITIESLGPGMRAEIDAAHSQVYLLNSIDLQAIVGDATFYFVIDEFSRFIEGLSVGLFNPSGEGVMLAIYNCYEDKVKYCEKFGIQITKEKWPNSGIPRILLADRGELVGLIPENAIKNLRIEIDNTRAYTPEDKPLIERLNRKIKDRLRTFLPGMTKKGGRERGESDIRMEATLTIEELTKIVIEAVIWHNNSPMNTENYTMSGELIRDNVEPIPCKIFDWGRKRFMGTPIYFDEDFVKLNLMKKDKATVTEKGILFKKVLYDCDIANVKRWYESAKDYGQWKVNIRYDRRLADNIYIINQDTKKFEICTLMPQFQYCKGKSFAEIEAYLVKKAQRNKELQNVKNEATNRFISNTEGIVREAKKRKLKNGYIPVKSKREMLKNMKENRRNENNLFGKKQAFKVTKKESSIPSVSNHIAKKSPNTNKVMDILKEALKGGNQ